MRLFSLPFCRCLRHDALVCLRALSFFVMTITLRFLSLRLSLLPVRHVSHCFLSVDNFNHFSREDWLLFRFGAHLSLCFLLGDHLLFFFKLAPLTASGRHPFLPLCWVFRTFRRTVPSPLPLFFLKSPSGFLGCWTDTAHNRCFPS